MHIITDLKIDLVFSFIQRKEEIHFPIFPLSIDTLLYGDHYADKTSWKKA